MTDATLELADGGLYTVAHEGVGYEGTQNVAIVGALLWLLEPSRLVLRGNDNDELKLLKKAHCDSLRLAYAITASLSPSVQPPMSRVALQSLLINACALAPVHCSTKLMQKTANALSRTARH